MVFLEIAIAYTWSVLPSQLVMGQSERPLRWAGLVTGRFSSRWHQFFVLTALRLLGGWTCFSRKAGSHHDRIRDHSRDVDRAAIGQVKGRR